MIYFTSDLHFCHNKDFCYLVRQCNDVEEMNEKIRENINKTVTEDDTLYILGDVYLSSDEGIEWFKKINCNDIRLIIGNHDTDNKLNNLMATGKIASCVYADIIKWGKYRFYLSHYPSLTGNEEKHLSTCLINLFGHTHQLNKFFQGQDGFNIPWMYNVGVDANDCTPVSIEEIIERCKIEFNIYITRKNISEEEMK